MNSETKKFQDQSNDASDNSRRDFIKTISLGALSIPLTSYLPSAVSSIAIVIEVNDAVAMSAPAQWAVSELTSTLSASGATVKRYNNINQVASGDICLVVPVFRQCLKRLAY
jgi:hypothetical protein